MISDRLLISNPKRLLCIFIGLLLVHSVVYFPIIVFDVNDVSGSDSIQVHNETNNNNTYIVVDTFMNWYEARSYCESQGGHLVTITSDAEQSLVHSLIQGWPTGVWIGLSDERIEGIWEWVTEEELIYTNWVDGEPIGADYAMMHDGHGQWDGSSQPLPFVCEWSDYKNSKPETFSPTSIVDRLLLFIFFVGAILGIVYYNRKIS